MTDAALPPRPMSVAARAVASSRIALWIAFVLAHLWLGMLALYAPGFPLGDVVLVYKLWSDQAIIADYWVGVDGIWVYPLLAIFPMLAAAALGPALYSSTWLSIVMLVDAVAFAAITGWLRSRGRPQVGWWWIAFLVLLGPIAVARIDSITVPLAIVGVLLLATRPRAAAVVLAVATWIKVWPAALLGAVVIASHRRWQVVAAAAGFSLAVVALALSFGSGANVFSFITEQTGRGLQVEAPVTTFWLWQALAGVPGTGVYYDTEILTYQVFGAHVDLVASLMTPVMALAVGGIVVLGIWATSRHARTTELLAPLALAIVAALIAFNKVGSPQFMTWLSVPVILGLAMNAAGAAAGSSTVGNSGRSFRVPAIIVLLLAALTQTIYPYVYIDLLGLDPVLLAVLTVRNLLVFVLLGWAVRAIVLAGLHARRDAGGDNGLGHPAHDATVAEPQLWPFESPVPQTRTLP